MMSNWYGNFSGPIDADDREVPLDTKVLYDANGKKLNITRFIFECDTHGCWADWRVFSPDINCEDGTLYVDGLYLTTPDTWEATLAATSATARGATVTDVRRRMAVKNFVSVRPLTTFSAEQRLLRKGMRMTNDEIHKIAIGLLKVMTRLRAL